jgi:hypothetical protein
VFLERFWRNVKYEEVSLRAYDSVDEARASLILTRPIHGGALKSWAMRLAKRAGMKKAKVALARKLAVVLHRMWVSASTFDFEKANGCMRAAG